jgi:bifunctional DNase/RNase
VREMWVMAVGVESGARRPVGIAEANAITVEQQRVSLLRPMTHQLIGDVIDAFGRGIEQVRITEVRDNIFYAELILDGNTEYRLGSATPSRSPCTSAYLSTPIHAEDSVLDAAAVASTAFRTQGDDRTPDEVEEFRRFLDAASPEDFDPG